MAMGNKEFQHYKDAVWQFMTEHCDYRPDGTLFIKFGASDRHDFEKRVWARWKKLYARPGAKERFVSHYRHLKDKTGKVNMHVKMSKKELKHLLEVPDIEEPEVTDYDGKA